MQKLVGLFALLVFALAFGVDLSARVSAQEKSAGGKSAVTGYDRSRKENDMDERTWLYLKTRLTDAWGISWKTATTLLPVLALLLTVLSAAATHKHNRLSVIPKLSFVWDTASDDVIGLSVENSGAGPAVIKNFAVKNFEAFSDQISDEAPVRRTFLPTYFFQQGARLGLITIERSKVKDLVAFEELIKGKLLVTIEYCSIYGDCWKECSNFNDPTCGYHSSPAEDIFNASVWSKVL